MKNRINVDLWLVMAIAVSASSIFLTCNKPDSKSNVSPIVVAPPWVSDSNAVNLVPVGKNSCGYEEYRHEKTGIVLLKIPAGSFNMGSEDAELDERPVHKVYLNEYYIGKYEITNAQYKKFCDTTKREYPKEPNFAGIKNYFEKYPEYPVCNISWEDARAFCAWSGLRLPTEAEWEKAARGNDGRKYPWGNEECDAGDKYRCNFFGNYTQYAKRDGYMYTSPVGFYSNGVSPYGCLDMAGNVWEWCADWYNAAYYGQSPKDNPQGPQSGTDRTIRGGSWTNENGGIRSANRDLCWPTERLSSFGFRVALSVK